MKRGHRWFKRFAVYFRKFRLPFNTRIQEVLHVDVCDAGNRLEHNSGLLFLVLGWRNKLVWASDLFRIGLPLRVAANANSKLSWPRILVRDIQSSSKVLVAPDCKEVLGVNIPAILGSRWCS